MGFGDGLSKLIDRSPGSPAPFLNPKDCAVGLWVIVQDDNGWVGVPHGDSATGPSGSDLWTHFAAAVALRSLGGPGPYCSPWT